MKVEDRIREAFGNSRYNVPGWTDPVGRIETGVRRRRRRQMIGASSAVALLAAVSIGLPQVWSRTGGPNSRMPAGEGQPVAWIDAPVAQPREIARRSPRPQESRCDKGAFGPAAWTEGKIGEAEPAWILIGNQKAKRCTIAGPVAIVAYSNTGERINVPAGPAIPAEKPMQYPATVDPGEPARFALMANGCKSPTLFRRPAFLIQDREISLPGVPEIRACSVSTGQWAVRPPALNATSQQVTIEAPKEARRGERLRYTVTLLNPSDSTLQLDPCPVYTQRLGSAAGTYKLNCPKPALDAHNSVKFAMELDVPMTTPLGKTTLSWTAIFPDGTVAIANISTGGVNLEVKP